MVECNIYKLMGELYQPVIKIIVLMRQKKKSPPKAVKLQRIVYPVISIFTLFNRKT